MRSKTPLRDPLLLFLLAAVLLLQLFAASAERVERWYSTGFYPGFSSGLRWLLGWLPFSLGDLLYGAAGVFLLLRLLRLIRWAWRRELRAHIGLRPFVRTAKVLLLVYLVFEVFWGLNYSRQDIARQLRLDLQPADTARLPELALLLQERLCVLGEKVDSLHRLPLNRNAALFEGAVQAYNKVDSTLPFLAYRHPSVKPSLYGPVAHLFGFSGYYNPFTGEAQVHTGFPLFMRPFVTCHEIGHQLGYAKEDEANFAGFLAARSSTDPDFRYSAYYDMYLYTLRELAGQDPYLSVMLRRTAHQQVRRDYRNYLSYLRANKNAIEPVVLKVYDRYLRLNNQAHGIETYDEVVLWLLAYMKKYGHNAI